MHYRSQLLISWRNMQNEAVRQKTVGDGEQWPESSKWRLRCHGEQWIAEGPSSSDSLYLESPQHTDHAIPRVTSTH
jgi:hypothetical protein